MGGNAVRLDKNPSPARGLKPPGRPRCPLVMKLMKSCRRCDVSGNVAGTSAAESGHPREPWGQTPTRCSNGLGPASSRCACPDSALRRSEEHTSELQSRLHLVCRLLLEKKKKSRIRDRG